MHVHKFMHARYMHGALYVTEVSLWGGRKEERKKEMKKERKKERKGRNGLKRGREERKERTRE